MIISKKDYKRSTWKNGLGFTDEIAIHPPGASLAKGDFLWRISSAQIANASPFSIFPSHERNLVILKGKGIRLFHSYEEGEPEEQVTLSPLEPYDFPGDVPSRCELVQGPIVDLSVFTRMGEVNANVSIQELAPEEEFFWNAEGKWNFIYAHQSAVESPGGPIQEGDTLMLEAGEWSIRASEAGAQLILISLEG